jgi:hypothetical protein
MSTPGSPARLWGMKEPVSPDPKENPVARPGMPRVEEPGGTYFVNFSLLDESTALTPAEREAVLLVILESNLKKYYLHAVVVMPTHIHMVVQALADGVPVPLPKITHHIKGFSSYKVNQLRGSKGPLWLPRSHNRC